MIFWGRKWKDLAALQGIDQVKPKVLAPGKYAIDVQPIPHRNRNNRVLHLVYLQHLKESVETLREIVEEAKAERPLDRSLASACRYTIHSQELVEYVIDTCLKALNTRANKHASTSLPKKKQVTFEEQCAMLKSRTDLPLVFGLRMFKTYDGGSLAAQEFYEKNSSGRLDSGMTTLVLSWVMETTVFGALCYPINDSEDLGKLQPIADIVIFIGYAPSRKGYRIYNKRTQHIMETIHVQFNELTEQMAHVQLSTRPAPTFMTFEHCSSSLRPQYQQNGSYATQYWTHSYFSDAWTNKFRARTKSSSCSSLFNSTGTPSSTTIDQDAPSPSHSPSSSSLQSPSLHQGVAAESTLMKDSPFAPIHNDHFINVFALEPRSEASSSRDLSSTESPYVSQTLHHLGKWSKDHPLDNIIGNHSRSVSTRKQLATDALWCFYNSVLSKVEPKNFKSAITKDYWFQAMQDEIHEFDRL
ncbi:retrovirus-related pol polyprotein from transposon TNT 1-94 [Tanacetum coccineum]